MMARLSGSDTPPLRLALDGPMAGTAAALALGHLS